MSAYISPGLTNSLCAFSLVMRHQELFLNHTVKVLSAVSAQRSLLYKGGQIRLCDGGRALAKSSALSLRTDGQGLISACTPTSMARRKGLVSDSQDMSVSIAAEKALPVLGIAA